MTKQRIISIVTAILVMLQIMLICPIELSAETPPQTTTYTGTGYTVEYTVKSSWDKTQNIGIKLNNTSDSPMSVWALKYNAHGEIRELYNGEVYKNEGTEYIIRSTSSNSSIEAGKSVEFGYSVTGENLSVPESIVLCSEQREANEAEYSVEFQLSEQWNPTYTAKIVLNNLSQFEMSGWSLSYDSNATVENIWNGKLLNQTDGRITVSGSAENFTIPTGGTTEININGKVSDEAPAAENFKLTYTYINEDIEDDNNGEEKEDVVIFAFGNYDEETDTLEVSWYSNTEKGTYEILKSEDNISYTTIASVTDTDNCSVAGTSLNNGTQYFKVKVTDESGRTAESIPFEVTKNKNGVTSGYIDTDKDGLADYLEETLGTDQNKADTDNDELTDYDEIYITGTDPLKADTDGNGTADGSEDPDTDGLNNIREIGLETDPLNPDTDGDGLTDGAEVNTHGTDPLKYDTDEDKISDGDEVKLGLNPKNPATNGVPDNEYTIPQKVTADSEAMSEINTEDNPYELSVEVKAAGNAENISVSESGYANAMHNDAILGIIPELSYDSNCKVDEVVVKFKLEDEALTEKTELPELKGIQRYQIFKFFEDDNMLLPIITEYNEATNTISATTDCLGTYCVMDMGNFLSSIAALENEGVTEEPIEPTPMLMSLNAEMPKLTVKPEDEFNVVFAVDTRFAGTPTWETILESISGSAEEIFSRSPKATVYLLEQNMPSATGDSVEEVGTYTNYDELTTAFEEYKNKESVINPLNQCDMSEAIDYVNKNIGKTLPTFMFSFLESQGAKYNKLKRDETINGINLTTDICLVLNNVMPSDTSFGSAAINNKAENVFKSYDSEDDIVNHIYDEKQVQTTYTIINSCGLKDVELKSPLTYKCFQAARGIITDYSGLADTDDDGLFDFQEIDCLSTLFTVDDYGKVFEYPTFAKCLTEKSDKQFYVDVGLEKYKEKLREDNSDKEEWYIDYLLYTTKVLPINSDPTNVDSDSDGLLDGKARFYNEKKIAPKDPHVLKIDGPDGVWKAQIELMQEGKVPNRLEDFCDYKGNDLKFSDIDWTKLHDFDASAESFIEYCAEFFDETTNNDNLLDYVRYKSDSFREAMLNWLKDDVNDFDTESVNAFLKEYTQYSNAINIGTFLLGFREDNGGVCIHSQTHADIYEYLRKKIEENCNDASAKVLLDVLEQNERYSFIDYETWQKALGYNDLYDNGFKFGTNGNMDREKFRFQVSDDEKYILWIWRGDYLNCGAGAEMGIYTNPRNLSMPDFKDWERINLTEIRRIDMEHWDAIDFELPMTLSLFNYNGKNNIENVMCWVPDNPQWWITGFNPQSMDVDVNKQVMVGMIDFGGREGMFDSLEENINDESNDLSKYLIFDEDKHTVWVIWYEDNLI